MNLEIENVKKTFGDKVAVNVDKYLVHSGEIVGLVGNNGAGKTTLFRIILDLLLPDTGSVTVNGYLKPCSLCTEDTNFASKQLHEGEYVSYTTSKCEDWKAFTGAYIDSGFLIDYLTPDEYFAFIGKVNGMSKEETDARLMRFENFMNGEVVGQNTLIRNLSAGNKQKVGIIGAMLNNPQLLILDEPFNFLDPSSQIAMKNLLESYNREMGATILVSSHNLTHTFDICTRITLLEHGVILKDYDKSYADLTFEIENYFKGNV